MVGPSQPPNEEILARTVHLMCKSNVSWQVWKETEPELFWFFERHFRAWKCSIRLTGDQNVYLVELELPFSQVGKIEKAMKDGLLAMELDKMHGLDPALNKRKDVKITKCQVTLAPAQPQNVEVKGTIEHLEQRLLELELHERGRSIDLRVVMERLQGFQLDMTKRLEVMEKKTDETIVALSTKIDKMDKMAARYKR
ncbi:hypothetical protein BC832DRAFT_590617 [Gaertneriomyces semiglobifer]|nr:hypothetical protein BC832DRAFT_590617 [Gaertneriomyces semiglobifer]